MSSTCEELAKELEQILSSLQDFENNFDETKEQKNILQQCKDELQESKKEEEVNKVMQKIITKEDQMITDLERIEKEASQCNFQLQTNENKKIPLKTFVNDLRQNSPILKKLEKKLEQMGFKDPKKIINQALNNVMLKKQKQQLKNNNNKKMQKTFNPVQTLDKE